MFCLNRTHRMDFQTQRIVPNLWRPGNLPGNRVSAYVIGLFDIFQWLSPFPFPNLPKSMLLGDAWPLINGMLGFTEILSGSLLAITFISRRFTTPYKIKFVIPRICKSYNQLLPNMSPPFQATLAWSLPCLCCPHSLLPLPYIRTLLIFIRTLLILKHATELSSSWRQS